AYPPPVPNHLPFHTPVHSRDLHSFPTRRSSDLMSVDQASREIEGGFSSLRTALGDPKAVAPFFRFPGLLRQTAEAEERSDRLRRSEEHTSELQSPCNLVCRLLLEKKKTRRTYRL